MRSRFFPRSIATILLALAAACDGPPAKFGEPRRLPKDQRPTVWDAPPKERLGIEEPPPAAGASARFAADTPEGWVEKPPRQFRDLIWGLPGEADGECWLTAGVGGGVAGNMTRWYRQFGLPPASAESLPEVSFLGGSGRLLELSGSYDGKPGTTMLLVFTSVGNRVTSLKLVASEAAAAENREKFLRLAETMRRESGPAPAAPGGAGGDPHGADSPHANTELVEPFVADVPPSWERSGSSTRPLHHTFGSGGEVYVSQLSGPLRQMLNIWRAELGMSQPMNDEEFAAVPKCEMLGPDARWLDISGDFTSMTGRQIVNARLLVAVRADGNTITFAKLIGPAAEVMAEVEAFRKFCASLRRNS